MKIRTAVGRKNSTNNFYQRLDPAGRILIPQEYRKRLASDEVWIVWAPPFVAIPHLRVMSPHQRDEYLKYLENLPEKYQTRAYDIQLFTEHWSRYRTFDELGRILLPRDFIEYAEMKDEVAITGNSWLFLWARHHFEAWRKQLVTRLEEFSEEEQRVLRWWI